MIGSIKEKMKNESGMAIVEATFVFPIMFIILFFLIYMGNAFYIKAQVESVVKQQAIVGASYCTDPILAQIKELGTVPPLNGIEVQPYRYFIGGMDTIEEEITKSVEAEINGNSSSFFKNMKPKIVNNKVKFNNYIVYSTFSVDLEYEIKFPIRFLGVDEYTVLEMKSRANVPVTDSTEFIRNTDMVMDFFSTSTLGKKIAGAFDKINDFIGSFADAGSDAD